jgi:ABC-type branched-subunit amino acid transport system substrate-binding protein
VSRRLRLGGPAAAVLSALLLVACGSSSSSSGGSGGGSGTTSAHSPFTIFAVVDLSGQTQAYGQQDKTALEASAAYMNQTGGIDGHPVKVTFADDQGDPTTAVDVLTKYMTTKSAPSLLYLGTTATDTGALVPAVKRYNVLATGSYDGPNLCQTDAQSACPRMFVVSQPEALTAEASAAYFKAHGYKKVGILEEEDAFSEHENGYTVKYLKKDGITPVVATFPSTAVSVTPELQEVAGQHVDALYSEALGPPAGFVARARQDLGLVGSLPLVFDGGGASADLTKLAPQAALVNSKELIQLPQDPKLKEPGRSLMLKYGAKYGGFDQPLDIGGFPWDDMIAIRAAAQQAGSIQLDKLAPALTDLSSQAQNSPLYMLTKAVKFTAGDHENGDATVNDFKVVPVGPLVNGMVQTSSS